MTRPVFPFLLLLLLSNISCQSLPAEGSPPAGQGVRVQTPIGHEAGHETELAQETTGWRGTAMDPLAQKVEIRRTSYGVPHILAEDLGGMGYGLALVMMEDYREQVAQAILQSNGRWGLAVGNEGLDGDFGGRMAHDFAAQSYHLLPADVRSVLDGFAKGMNDFARVYRDELPEWVPEDFTAHDIAARDIGVWDGGAVRSFLRGRTAAENETMDSSSRDAAEGPDGRVARAVARPSPLRSEQGDFHHSALPLRSLTEPSPRSERRSGVVGAGAP